MRRWVVPAMAAIVSVSLALGMSRVAAEDPGTAGPPPPFTHDLTFKNDTPFSADRLFVELSAYTWQVDVLEQPARCPIPLVDTGVGSSVDVAWYASCVHPGESVTFRLYGECDGCPPPKTTVAWSHDWVGDADCDKATNSIDAVLILQRAAALIGAVACELNADVNGDDAVNAVDALLVLQLDAGLITL